MAVRLLAELRDDIFIDLVNAEIAKFLARLDADVLWIRGRIILYLDEAA